MPQSKSTPKLTDTMLVILSRASNANGRVLPIPSSVRANKGAVTKTLNALLKRGLIEEASAKAGDAIWRQDGDLPLSLKLTKAGAAAVEGIAPTSPKVNSKGTKETKSKRSESRNSTDQPALPSFRPGSKLALLVEALSAPSGTTINDLCEQLDWQPHSVRAALSTLRHKHGFTIERIDCENARVTYRLAESKGAA